MLPRRAAAPLSCALLLLAGCGDGGPDTTGTSEATTATGAARTTTTATTGATTTTGGGAVPAGAPPAASAAQVAAIPSGLVPAAAEADDATDPALIDELRTRLARSPAAMREAGSARFRIDLRLSSGPVGGTGVADFRTGASRNALRVGSGAGAPTVDQYNDGRVSYTRAPGGDWSRETSPIPNAPGNSTGLLAGQLRVGRAGAETTVEGTRCRWAGGVVPLRELLRAGGAEDAAPAVALLRAARPDAVYPIGACVSEDGLLAELRYDVRFDRDLGLPGTAGRETFEGGIAFSDFGAAPAVRRPPGLPTG